MGHHKDIKGFLKYGEMKWNTMEFTTGCSQEFTPWPLVSQNNTVKDILVTASESD